MRWGHTFSVVGILLVFCGLAMALPMLVGLYYQDQSIIPLAKGMGITLLVGAMVYLAAPTKKQETLSHREGMAIVALGWAAVGVAGALPFYFSSSFLGFTDAVFESVSGFTTTGSSVLSDIEGVSKGLLMWRSMIQWLGGMGIIVLSVAILPFLGVGGMQLYKAEVPTPVPDKLKPRIRDTAVILWQVYALFTVLEAVLLFVGGMSVFDAVCHAFTTMPTGGFSTLNTSVGQYHSPYFEWVIIFFMIVAGINFSLHFQLLRGKPMALWKDPECRFFLGLVLVLVAVITLDIHGKVFSSLNESIRASAFQVSSIITTTGYATADYELWPALSQLLIMFCMVVGASAGSTGGGIKCLRVMLLFKYCYRELFRMIHPRAVIPVKLGGRVVPEEVLHSVCAFFVLYMGLFAISALGLAAMGVDLVTSMAAVAATIGNIGPGIGGVGPMDNFANIPLAGKWLLVWCMLLGRLEIYTVIILFVPEFWRK
ncbi:TrkH family potassium uptake protein [Desulfatibacillum aliphaticivorans]|uniref:TrkH family potassium uptake protein n=1 Tax=Desulfatibacillum aliphaticivorans TaxID=218208 RepID=UPI00041D238D|nr:TrkH family potassium uptake protein [Desulfatibacillum aliphaticivorans]